MIETEDIYRSIKLLLEENFTEIPVQIKDIKFPAPPCFYIKFISSSVSQSALEYEKETLSFDVIYFSKDETLLDLLEKKSALKKLFSKPLKIDLSDTTKLQDVTQWQEIDDITTSLNEEDYVLTCTLNINLNQYQGSQEQSENTSDTDFIDRYDEFKNEETIEEIEI